LSESDYLNGNTLLAIEQLEKALDLSTLDFAIASRIAARYKELRQEWREIQETQRESEVEKKKDDE
jgi:predicted Zn-dependent protease